MPVDPVFNPQDAFGAAHVQIAAVEGARRGELAFGLPADSFVVRCGFRQNQIGDAAETELLHHRRSLQC